MTRPAAAMVPVLPKNWQLRDAGLRLHAQYGLPGVERIADLRKRGFGNPDADSFDRQSLHLIVEGKNGQAVAASRLRLHGDATSLAQGYAGQFYHLNGLAKIGFPLVELGRLCTATDGGHPAALRLLWAGMAELASLWQVQAIFGCASFAGAEADLHAAAIGVLAMGHQDAKGHDTRANVASSQKVVLADVEQHGGPAVFPPLLRSYLSLGAWVGPEAVIDPDLDTMHVLTVLETARIPTTRRTALAAYVAACGGGPVNATD